MHIAAGGRQSGKTSFAVEWAREVGGIIVVPNHRMAESIIHDYGLPSKKVHSVDGVRLRGSLRTIKPSAICVENVDIVLPYLLGLHQPVDLITATTDGMAVLVPGTRP